MNFPEAFEHRIKEQLGSDYQAYLDSYNRPVHNAIRVNTLKITPSEYLALTDAALAPVPWNNDGFYCEGKKAFSKNPLYHAGLYYIQEPSAMLPAKLAGVKPGDYVLDMCAAPGGKSTALGAALQGEGLLVSNDISASRARALLKNIEAFGITNAMVLSEYPEKLTRYFQAFFDKIVIDAPCSGEGMFHKEPGMTAAWEKNGPEFYRKIQEEIIEYGAMMLKDGGDMVYSTCTFSPQEDEGVIAGFLSKHPEFSVVPISMEERLCGCQCADHGHPEWGDGQLQLADTLRLWPQHIDGEGHFAALLHKSGTTPAAKKPETIAKRKKALELFYDFLDSEGIAYAFDDERLTVLNGYVQYLPDTTVSLKGLHILRSGWFLGEIKKNRFEPSGAFARGLQRTDCEKVINYEYTDSQVLRYLKCETLEVDENLPGGWYLICASGYPLGWGKVSRGTLKNKYPSGWRWV